MRRTSLLQPRKCIAYAEASSELSEHSLDESSFRSSTSIFGETEERAMRISINEKASFVELLPFGAEETVPVMQQVPDHVRCLYLPNFDADQVRIFHPSRCPDLSKDCASFLVKLRFVLINNDQSRGVPKEEGYIDDLMLHIMKVLEFDDGLNMIVKHCYLDLTIGTESFSANADCEGCRALGIIWVLQESKHTYDTRYKEGDVQLIACMLAACQSNYNQYLQYYPTKIFGIKTRGDQLSFYCITVDQAYMESLKNGLPLKRSLGLAVAKYPAGRGLRLSNPVERAEALQHLWRLRQYAMTLDPFDQ